MVSRKNLVLVFLTLRLVKFKISKNQMIDTIFVAYERLIHFFFVERSIQNKSLQHN